MKKVREIVAKPIVKLLRVGWTNIDNIEGILRVILAREQSATRVDLLKVCYQFSRVSVMHQKF